MPRFGQMERPKMVPSEMSTYQWTHKVTKEIVFVYHAEPSRSEADGLRMIYFGADYDAGWDCLDYDDFLATYRYEI